MTREAPNTQAIKKRERKELKVGRQGWKQGLHCKLLQSRYPNQ